jgi:hypothetical protein
MAWFTGALFFANVALLLLQACQLKAIDGQLKEMQIANENARESNEHAYRAWLTVKGQQNKLALGVGSHVVVNIGIENTGISDD